VVRGHVVTAVSVPRAFDAVVGDSPMAYLRQMRVQRMAQLLASTDPSIAEAARPAGWTDPNYASRCFHAVFGVSPTAFRRRQTAPPPIGSPGPASGSAPRWLLRFTDAAGHRFTASATDAGCCQLSGHRILRFSGCPQNPVEIILQSSNNLRLGDPGACSSLTIRLLRIKAFVAG
jgi:hypothetical protein